MQEKTNTNFVKSAKTEQNKTTLDFPGCTFLWFGNDKSAMTDLKKIVEIKK